MRGLEIRVQLAKARVLHKIDPEQGSDAISVVMIDAQAYGYKEFQSGLFNVPTMFKDEPELCAFWDIGQELAAENHPSLRAKIIAKKVEDRHRLDILPRYFGKWMLRAESFAFAILESLSPDYEGGLWNFYELSNGGFYMAPAYEKKLRLKVRGNGFDGTVSADAAGIVTSLNVFCYLSEKDNKFANSYHLLRDFAVEHEEAGAICRAID